MKRLSVIPLVLALALSACADDQVVLRRGPLGPASYRVAVDAEGTVAAVRISRRATLRITPRPRGAMFTMRTGDNDTPAIQADVRLLEDGSVTLDEIRGTAEEAGHTELASLAGQLSPQLPDDPVRIGEHWTSRQRISTKSLTTDIRTTLHIVRFSRLDGLDAAEFDGTLSGRLRTSTASGVFEGRLTGQTSVVWAVEDGRVITAQTVLKWTLESGDTVTLTTSVRPTS